MNKGNCHGYNFPPIVVECGIKCHKQTWQLPAGGKQKTVLLLCLLTGLNINHAHVHSMSAKLFLSHTQSRVVPCLSPQSPAVMECEIHKLESGSVRRERAQLLGWRENTHQSFPDRLSARGTTHSSDVTSCSAGKEIPGSIQLHSHSRTHRET